MKNLQRICAAVALMCMLAVAVSAGDMSAGGVTPPPPPPPTSSQTATTEGEISCGVTADVIAALLGLLSVL